MGYEKAYYYYRRVGVEVWMERSGYQGRRPLFPAYKPPASGNKCLCFLQSLQYEKWGLFLT
jgi:hypothetical protein